MTDPAATPGVPAAVATPDGHADRIAQLKAGGFVIGALVVLGVVLGVIWEAWSPPGPVGGLTGGGVQADETEAFIAGDGRFALLTVIVGVVAGVAAWYLRRVRGPILALALGLGSLGGAALAEWVGYLIRGSGNTFSCNSGTGRCIDHLPLTVHMHALLLVEATAAVLVYTLCVAFAVSDDLGRPDPGRVLPQPEPTVTWQPAPAGYPPPSVGAQYGPQDPWRDGDAPGPA